MEIRRPESDADVAGLIRAHGLSWRAAYDEILPDAVLAEMTVEPTPEDVAAWRDRLAGNDRAVFVAVDGETVTGFVDVRWGGENTKSFVGRGEAGVKAIYVRPDRWGEGFGTALLERGLDALPDCVETVRLEALAENDIGAEFYEARGFERTDAIEREVASEPRVLDVWTKRI